MLYYEFDEYGMYSGTIDHGNDNAITVPPPVPDGKFCKVTEDRTGWTVLYGVNNVGAICNDQSSIVFVPPVAPNDVNSFWSFSYNKWMAPSEAALMASHQFNIDEVLEVTWKNGETSRNSYGILSPNTVAGLESYANYPNSSFFLTDDLHRCSVFGYDSVLNTLTTYVFHPTPSETQMFTSLLASNGIESVYLHPFFGKKMFLNQNGESEVYTKISTLSYHQHVPFDLPAGNLINGEAYIVHNGVVDTSIREIYFSIISSEEQAALSEWCSQHGCTFSAEPFDTIYDNCQARHYSVVFENNATHTILFLKQYVKLHDFYTYQELNYLLPNLSHEEITHIVSQKQQLDAFFEQHNIATIPLTLPSSPS